jgi:transposase-like protein
MSAADFPRTLRDFFERFPTEDACWKWLVEQRWPDGYQCPDEHPGWLIKSRKLFECESGHQWSVTSGTIMHGTQQPLRDWFLAAYLMVTMTPGISARQLATQLGRKSTDLFTPYAMLHKLRAAMVPAMYDDTKLHGTIQADEVFISGGREREGRKGKAQCVVAALEVKDEKAGRIRIKKISGPTTHNLSRFMVDNVARNAIITTDGAPGYKELRRYGYDHRVDMGQEYKDNYPLPELHRVFSNLKTWILGTHHGAIMHKHLQAYLNEFAFRFNFRHNKFAAFQILLGIGTHVEAPTYKELFSGEWKHSA